MTLRVDNFLLCKCDFGGTLVIQGSVDSDESVSIASEASSSSVSDKTLRAKLRLLRKRFKDKEHEVQDKEFAIQQKLKEIETKEKIIMEREDVVKSLTNKIEELMNPMTKPSKESLQVSIIKL